MMRTEIFEIANRALDLFETDRGHDAVVLMHGLVGGAQDNELRSAAGDRVYDVLMEIYIYVTSGDLAVEGRTDGFGSVAECRTALNSLASKS